MVQATTVLYSWHMTDFRHGDTRRKQLVHSHHSGSGEVTQDDVAVGL